MSPRTTRPDGNVAEVGAALALRVRSAVAEQNCRPCSCICQGRVALESTKRGSPRRHFGQQEVDYLVDHANAQSARHWEGGWREFRHHPSHAPRPRDGNKY